MFEAWYKNMKLDNMFKKSQVFTLTEGEREQKSEVPEGLLRKCNLCKKVILTEERLLHLPQMRRLLSYARHGADSDDCGSGQL